jgi:peptidoglycan LD-endopeptidase LytH
VTSPKRPGGSVVLLAGLGGFALGAATVLLVVWFYGVRGGPGTAGAVPGAPAAAARAQPAAGQPGQAAPGAELPGGPPAAAPPAAPVNPPSIPPAPGAPGAAGVAPGAAAIPGAGAPGDLDALRSHHLLLPVQGLRREELHDSFAEGRGGHVHEALDIMATRNTPVLAVEDGRLARLFNSRQGGNTIYQSDPSETYTYYYAHLERYADGLREGAPLRRGQVIGYVGTSGNAPPNSPHLHFAIFRMTPEKQWWKGIAIDPYLVLAQP